MHFGSQLIPADFPSLRNSFGTVILFALFQRLRYLIFTNAAAVTLAR